MKLVVALSVFTWCAAFAVRAEGVDLYWLAYPSPGGGDNLMLTQIDASGKISAGPVRVLGVPAGYATNHDREMFFDSQKRLNMWIHPSQYRRLVFSLEDLHGLSAKPRRTFYLNFTRANWLTPCVTQRANGNFLTLNVPAPPGLPTYWETPTAYRISDVTGGVLSGPWSLFSQVGLPAGFNINHGGVVSLDGLVGYFYGGVVGGGVHGLYLQRLGANGRAMGMPVKIESFASDSIQATNRLPDGKRHVVYVRNLAPWKNVPDAVFLRTIDSAVTTTGPRIRVSSPARIYLSMNKALAMDPKGRFIVYGAQGPINETTDCGIFYQALDPSTGNRVGSERRILPETCGGLTMAKEPD